MALILQQSVNALTVGAIYALIALGYTMVYGVLRLINFAHSEMFTAGAFVAVFAAGLLGGVAGHPGVALLAGLIAFVAIGLLGVTVEAVAYRPLRGTSRLAPMLSALGMAVVIQNAVMLLGGRRPLIYPSFLPRGVMTIGDVLISYKQVTILAVALALMVGLELLVNRTSLGIRIRAVAESPETASLVGIDPNLPIAVIFFVGPGLGAVAGVLYSSYYGVATFSMGFIVGMKAFTAAILGGIGSITGAVLGGLLLGAIETFATAWLPTLTNGVIGTEYRDIFAFTVLVLILLFRPAGLLGEHVSEESMVYKRDFSAPFLRALAIMALVPIGILVIGSFLPAYPLRVLDLILLYAMLGMGLNVVVGYAGLLDLGYVAFYAIGAYTYALLASPQFGLHLPFPLILLIGGGLAMVAGVLLGIPVLRLRGDYLAIVTLGFGEIIRVLMNNLDTLTNGPQGIARIDEASVLGWHITTALDALYLLVGLTVLSFLFVWRLQVSALGTALAAVREDQDAARGCGIDTTAVKLIAFATSASIGGVGGVVFAAMQRFVSPESFTFWESLSIVLVVVVGGLGNPFGAVLGAGLLVLIPEIARSYADYRQLLYGLALVLIILARPMGLIPRQFGPSWLVRKLATR